MCFWLMKKKKKGLYMISYVKSDCFIFKMQAIILSLDFLLRTNEQTNKNPMFSVI